MSGSIVPKEVVVIGVGQSLRGDDALGLEVVRFWQTKYPDTSASVRIVISEQLDFELLASLNSKNQVILVDALSTTEHEGTLLRIALDELDSVSLMNLSSHGWGIVETLRLWERLFPDRFPKKLILIGITSHEFALGRPISDSGLVAIEPAANKLEEEVNLLLKSVPPY